MPNLQDIVSTVAAPVLAGFNVASKALAPITNPVINRLTNSGLLNAGKRSAAPRVNFNDSQANTDSWKVRIRISENSPILYNSGDGLLTKLHNTGGVIFPYTPQITVTYQANYTTQRFTHSNYAHYSYDQSEIQNIQITADFTAQNKEEAQYVLACIYFFRAATKMFFGLGDKLAGNPPPIVFLNGYGQHYFPDVPCVITSFSHTMPSEVDYIETSSSLPEYESGYNDQGQAVGISTGKPGKRINPETGETYDSGSLYYKPTRIPTQSQILLGLQPVYSKDSLIEFNLNDFAQGKLFDKRFI